MQGELTEKCDSSIETKGPFQEEASPRMLPYGKFHTEFRLILLEISLV